MKSVSVGIITVVSTNPYLYFMFTSSDSGSNPLLKECIQVINQCSIFSLGNQNCNSLYVLCKVPVFIAGSICCSFLVDYPKLEMNELDLLS